MLNVTAHEYDALESVLPTVELAMQTGDVCCINKINHLGLIAMAALRLLAESESLMDTDTGEVLHPQPGFHLIGIDERGETRTLM